MFIPLFFVLLFYNTVFLFYDAWKRSLKRKFLCSVWRTYRLILVKLRNYHFLKYFIDFNSWIIRFRLKLISQGNQRNTNSMKTNILVSESKPEHEKARNRNEMFALNLQSNSNALCLNSFSPLSSFNVTGGLLVLHSQTNIYMNFMIPFRSIA